jgi:hypothetical protein
LSRVWLVNTFWDTHLNIEKYVNNRASEAQQQGLALSSVWLVVTFWDTHLSIEK